MSEHESCKHLISTLSEYLDGILDESLCVELERHMRECDRCSVVVNTMRKTIELYHENYPSPDVPEDVRDRLFQKLALDDYLKK